MVIKQEQKRFPLGYTSITEIDGAYKDMMLDFGILKLTPGEGKSFYEEEKEQVFLLMTGEIELSWTDLTGIHSAEVKRTSVLDEMPTALQVGRGVKVEVKALNQESEIAVQKVINKKAILSKLWKPGDYRSDRFGEGTLQDTSTRLVRTIFDSATAPDSELVVGEVINFPGKWSSYPPHDHAQPEVYHYRFFPDHGYGHAELEDSVFKIQNGDSFAITPMLTHSQCAAPGYAMYYIWMIPHLPNDKFGPDSRIFRKEYAWVQDPKAPIWPDATLDEIAAYHKK